MSSACESLTISAEALALPTVAIRPVTPLPRHPLGFYIVCLVVVCERWAAYTLSSLVVLMLSERYGYSRVEALRLMSMANAACYLGTLPGAVFAEKVLGHRRALSLSTVLLALGYAALISSRAVALIPSLMLLAAGSALFKPSTQAVLLRLYPSGDARLEGIQTWFYLAANAGAASGALVAGLLVRRGDWSAAFAFAAAAMLTARALLMSNREALRHRPTGQPASSGEAFSIEPRRRLLTIMALIFAMLVYTVCAAQVEGALLLWARDRTQRWGLGFEVPAAWFVALPALLVLMFGPAQLALLPYLQRRVDTRNLIAIGLVSVALAFVVLLSASAASPPQGISMIWFVGAMTLLVIGELLVAPLGIAQVLRLAPQRCGLVVGFWYISGAVGHWLAGEVGAWSVRGTGSAGFLVLAALPTAGAMVLFASRMRDEG